jgi:hypothetical protein
MPRTAVFAIAFYFLAGRLQPEETGLGYLQTAPNAQFVLE